MQIDLEEDLAPHRNIISKSAILPKHHDTVFSCHLNEIVFSVLTNVSYVNDCEHEVDVKTRRIQVAVSQWLLIQQMTI